MDIGAAGQNGRIVVFNVETVIERDFEIATIQDPCVEVCIVQDHQLTPLVVLWRDVPSVRILLSNLV